MEENKYITRKERGENPYVWETFSFIISKLLVHVKYTDIFTQIPPWSFCVQDPSVQIFSFCCLDGKW